MAVKRFSLIFSVFVGLLFSTSVFPNENNKTYFINTKISLMGILQTEQKYGSPNYGETPDEDTSETVFVLHLPNPVTFYKGKKKQKVVSEGLNRVQLINLGDKGREQAKGSCITVTGEAFEANSGHHHYPIVLDVEKIENC